MLELWQQLSTSSPGLLSSNKKMKEKESSLEGVAKEPLIDFVNMECELAGDLCTSVDTALTSLKKVKPALLAIF